LARRVVVGFYTDKKNRIRPITKSSGKRWRFRPPKYEPRVVKGKDVEVEVWRSRRAWAMDESKTAKEITEKPEEWLKAPDRVDYPGVDTK
jgi:hypothetical protein